jgi:hypothetical protein
VLLLAPYYVQGTNNNNPSPKWMNKGQVSCPTERTIARQNLASADLESTGTITGADAVGEIEPRNEAVRKESGYGQERDFND